MTGQPFRTVQPKRHVASITAVHDGSSAWPLKQHATVATRRPQLHSSSILLLRCCGARTGLSTSALQQFVAPAATWRGPFEMRSKAVSIDQTKLSTGACAVVRGKKEKFEEFRVYCRKLRACALRKHSWRACALQSQTSHSRAASSSVCRKSHCAIRYRT